MSRWFARSLISGAIVTLAVIVFGAAGHVPGRASAQGTVDNLAIDVDTTGNTATSVAFPLDTCVEIANGASRDIDIVVGPNGIPVGQGLKSFQLTMSYNGSVMKVTAADAALLINSNLGSSAFGTPDPVPDEDGSYTVAALDLGTESGETGPGVLARVTLEAKAVGTSALDLPTGKLFTAGPTEIPVDKKSGAAIVVTASGSEGACLGDSDGDGIDDSADLCPNTAEGASVDANGCSDAQVDEDEDGVCDTDAPSAGPSSCQTGGGAGDLCPGTAQGDEVDASGCSDAQVDPDSDGVCSPDAPEGSFGPSACSGSDNCPNDANPDQEDTDNDGVGDACTGDRDGDGIDDEEDNCPTGFNPNQEDADDDGLGNICDEDDDGDGVKDADDNCPLKSNPDQKDSDGDGTGDECDETPVRGVLRGPTPTPTPPAGGLPTTGDGNPVDGGLGPLALALIGMGGALILGGSFVTLKKLRVRIRR